MLPPVCGFGPSVAQSPTTSPVVLHGPCATQWETDVSLTVVTFPSTQQQQQKKNKKKNKKKTLSTSVEIAFVAAAICPCGGDPLNVHPISLTLSISISKSSLNLDLKLNNLLSSPSFFILFLQPQTSSRFHSLPSHSTCCGSAPRPRLEISVSHLHNLAGLHLQQSASIIFCSRILIARSL